MLSGKIDPLLCKCRGEIYKVDHEDLERGWRKVSSTFLEVGWGITHILLSSPFFPVNGTKCLSSFLTAKSFIYFFLIIGAICLIIYLFMNFLPITVYLFLLDYYGIVFGAPIFYVLCRYAFQRGLTWKVHFYVINHSH